MSSRSEIEAGVAAVLVMALLAAFTVGAALVFMVALGAFGVSVSLFEGICIVLTAAFVGSFFRSS